MKKHESDAMGMVWWNRLSEAQRARVLRQSFAILGDASPADAWRLWRGA